MSQIVIPSPPHSTGPDDCDGLIITGSGELRPTTRPGIPRINLTPLDDIAYGTNQDEEFAALEGNDLVGGGGGNDVIQGNQGEDTLSGGEGDDSVMGGKGNDIVDGNAGNDVLYGDRGDDILYGGGGNDYIESPMLEY
ncbi:MAG TPA: hypothetical protein DD001_10430 [Microcoleaceae bacterium UBA10368]|jgi:RTX toxins and related Ca2+-binding proteins|nr:hypothetical protein [Microcoleaceae cyanobacterium UBA10368]HCV32824.1 hypothetical protein [Microcoleaceae cyanobacterium UBA9251]